jgi:hypothetical protein
MTYCLTPYERALHLYSIGMSLPLDVREFLFFELIHAMDVDMQVQVLTNLVEMNHTMFNNDPTIVADLQVWKELYSPESMKELKELIVYTAS